MKGEVIIKVSWEIIWTVLQANGILSSTNYRGTEKPESNGNDLTWSSNNSLVNPQMLFDAATFTLGEMITYFLIRLIKAKDTGDNMILVNTSNQNGPSFFKEYRRQTGKCYSFHPDEHIAELGVYYIRIKL